MVSTFGFPSKHPKGYQLKNKMNSGELDLASEGKLLVSGLAAGRHHLAVPAEGDDLHRAWRKFLSMKPGSVDPGLINPFVLIGDHWVADSSLLEGNTPILINWG